MDYHISSYLISLLIIIGIVLVTFGVLIKKYILDVKSISDGVYIKNPLGIMHKSALAGRFSMMVVTNTISEQCLSDRSYIGLWKTIAITLESIDDGGLYTADEIHDKLLNHYEQIRYKQLPDKLSKSLDDISNSIDDNLRASKISHPPLFKMSTYANWINYTLSKYE